MPVLFRLGLNRFEAHLTLRSFKERERQKQKKGAVHRNSLLKLSWRIHSVHSSEAARASDLPACIFFFLWLAEEWHSLCGGRKKKQQMLLKVAPLKMQLWSSERGFKSFIESSTEQRSKIQVRIWNERTNFLHCSGYKLMFCPGSDCITIRCFELHKQKMPQYTQDALVAATSCSAFCFTAVTLKSAITEC